MADYKHLNNNTTTHADAFPPGRRGRKKKSLSGKDKPEEYYGLTMINFFKIKLNQMS